mmetsp:Transcript_34367/g.80307  ORF Transcript_34367/g.80307 Transcript_34367/m.80307 type:complete len:189 (-) Transcript_34367:9-575(-)|eukprot:CAMPEP_0175965638 /NCGR_PEP_ID=MMETSP0108-20121206/38221_1 /TAXON_ID=195067 ORGANISM="Goniomonas pacifica, Strain CCMP1869" /NCGR_SAMPLE_ID=MMETSP0108 /ASSEMBLY_ACC=CAM_ASM_000204 /LENGTH=188 /DNA_ID=CAMNT_0017293739 /DNA_START=51 /DNA_END=617 /DNA_ORIENTATION=+
MVDDYKRDFRRDNFEEFGGREPPAIMTSLGAGSSRSGRASGLMMPTGITPARPKIYDSLEGLPDEQLASLAARTQAETKAETRRRQQRAVKMLLERNQERQETERQLATLDEVEAPAEPSMARGKAPKGDAELEEEEAALFEQVEPEEEQQGLMGALKNFGLSCRSRIPQSCDAPRACDGSRDKNPLE